MKLKLPLVKIAFQKFKFKIDPSETTKLEFKNHELHEIELQLDKLKDIDVDIYYFLISNESYHSNNKFMKVLNLLIAEPDFIIILCEIWKIFRTFLHDKPKPQHFEHSFQRLYLARDKYEAIQNLETLYNTLKLETCQVSFKLFSCILIRNFKLLFIVALRKIVFVFIDTDTVITPGKVTQYQVETYGGSTLCTILHIWYNSNIRDDRKIVLIRLTKSLIITPTHQDYSKVSKQYQYENRGFFYVLAPRGVEFTQTILNRCWEQAQRSYHVRCEVPNYNQIIKGLQMDTNLIKSFCNLFEKEDVVKHTKCIEDIFNKYVKHCCNKIVNTSVDQLGLSEIGMGLRDGFKYEHIH